MTADEVFNTVGYDGFVRSLFNRSGDPAKDFAHAVLGIVTEIYELRQAPDKVNAIEEGGDLTFYTQALGQVINDFTGKDHVTVEEIDEYIERHMEAHVGTMSTYVDKLCNELLDSAKRWAGYGKVPPDLTGDLCKALFVVLTSLEDTNTTTNTTKLERVNVEKLLERYNGMQFTLDRAINRDLVAERAVLESASGA